MHVHSSALYPRALSCVCHTEIPPSIKDKPNFNEEILKLQMTFLFAVGETYFVFHVQCRPAKPTGLCIQQHIGMCVCGVCMCVYVVYVCVCTCACACGYFYHAKIHFSLTKVELIKIKLNVATEVFNL